MQPKMDKDLSSFVLDKISHDGTVRPAVFSYESKHFGLLNYLKIRAKEERIKTQVYGNTIMIFSKNKKSKFEELVKEALSYTGKEFVKTDKELISYTKQNTLIGVYLNQGNEVYTTVHKIHILIYYIFVRQIPKPHYFYIFKTKIEMDRFLEREKKVWI